jgi:phosphomannomutase
MNLDELLLAATAWAEQDPDAQTRSELLALIAARDEAALLDRCGKRLGFGTAGLRGELGAGPNRMNRVLVAQAAAGLAAYLKKNFDRPSAVIGYDGRVNSDVFARDSAEVMAAAGIETFLFDQSVPTPVLAFAVKQRDFSAGVMVTASHNPPRDNGYKVYLGGANGGGQIVSPADAEISEEIEAVAAAKTFAQIAKSDNFEFLGESTIDDYVRVTSRLVNSTADDKGEGQLKIVYSAMHGVGWPTLEKLFAAASIAKPIVVESQIKPDGNFPTVAFPNPEEPGAMDESYATAFENDADLILVNDPDADRLAVAIPTVQPDGSKLFKRLTGDQIGLLLADELASRPGAKGALACSIVSCSALEQVAAKNGLAFVETLTGFKWISKVPELLFGFEEALGYCVDPAHTPDKDGISAALVVADLANRLAASDQTIADRIDEIGRKYGHFATGQVSIRVADLSIIGSTVARIRNNPPAAIMGQSARFTDLALGSAKLQATEGLRFDLADGSRVIIRPSGTEPKLKCYLQTTGDSFEAAQSALEKLESAARELLNA